jgi:hypothetical protein
LILKHVVHHGLGFETAKKVAEAAVGSYTARFQKYDPKISWKTERKAEISFKVKGVSLEGVLEVGDENIEMDLDVPFLLRPFKGTALSVIDEEIKKWLVKAKAGEI